MGAAADQTQSSSTKNEDFFPKGAIAFFAAMLIGFGIIWLGIYLILLQRQLWL